MAKAIKEILMGISADTNLKIGTNKTVQASGVFVGNLYRVKRTCTKTDNDLKAVMVAHLKARASKHASC